MKKIAMTLMAVVVVPFLIMAGTDKDKKDKKDNGAPEPRVVTAVRTTEPIAIDGRLTEQAWQRPGSNGFTQNDPQDGAPSTEKTDVWVAYDDKALYVAAYCHDSEPKGIKSLLGRRDSQIDSDWFFFAVDPYFDKMTGYLFGVNPAGSILDEALSNDVNEDTSWDGAWESKAAINGDGWVVELKVPFHQIRFPKKDEYVWGVNFSRVIKRKQERASFSWVPKDVPAFVSRFARLEGISGISAGMHIELMPYTVGQARFRPAEPGNPFETGHRYRGNLGFDLKVGLKSNLTLDATVNPDFGQVEVDPAVINLSAYETYFEEKRPFFIEGASIFNGFGRGGVYLNANMNWPYISLFFSRRIGREPQGYVTEPGYTDVPERSAILGAAKITGKLGGWNIGFINALTSREYATIDQSGIRLEQEVAPFSYYGVLRAQKDINEGQHGIGFMATGVARDNANPVLNGILNKNAFSLAVDGWSFLDKKRTYVIGGWFAGTRIGGSAEDIFRLQNSSTHYFQRPDATQVELDPTATSLSGWGGRLQFAKQSGNLLWAAAVGALSPGFDPNDAGYQSSASDVINISFLPGYQWTKPGKLFQYALVALGGLETFDFGGHKTAEAGVALVQGTFKNFWNFNTQVVFMSQSYNTRLTRGGPLSVSLPGYEVDSFLSTDSRKAFVLEGSGSVSKNRTNSQSWSAGLSVRWKPSGNVSLSVGPQYMAYSSETQWVGRFQDDLMTSTYGSRYVFGNIQQKVISAEIRLNWTFTPRLTLQAYLQPFIGVGKYDRFKELARPKAYAYNTYGESGSTIDYADGDYVVDPDGAGPATPFVFGNPDFNVKSLRGTVVLRWEYLPGSLLYAVWTQNRADFAHPGDLQLRRDLSDLFTAPGENIFMLKFSYRWNK